MSASDITELKDNTPSRICVNFCAASPSAGIKVCVCNIRVFNLGWGASGSGISGGVLGSSDVSICSYWVVLAVFKLRVAGGVMQPLVLIVVDIACSQANSFKVLGIMPSCVAYCSMTFSACSGEWHSLSSKGIRQWGV
eukprot:15365435-Ditylum_brightwellii.AAC.1